MAGGKKRRRRGPGIAYLVGAGPGDPGLMTVRGAELLRAADAIVFDALANPELVRAAQEAAASPIEMHDVGKRGGDAEGSARQEMISELLVRLVRQGKKVVRLKGGDPFVFGRGGEEAQALAEAGLPFEIVPGITAGIAAPAYAGIPVTHRGLATSVTFVTGHEDPMKGAPRTDWAALAKSGGTIVLYMGMRKLASVAQSLIEGGLPPEIPAAIIEWGTHNRQRSVVATLETIAEAAERDGIGAPAIAVVGWTVVLRDEIAWFDRRPLFGRRILVTRAGESTGPSSLGDRLRAAGADVLEIPTTKIVPVEQGKAAIRERLTKLTDYSWLIFTSANAVRFFWDELSRARLDSRSLATTRICAIGPATAESLMAKGVIPDVQPARFAAEGLVDALRDRSDVAGTKILYPCAAGARALIQEELEKVGATVDRIHLYRSAPDESNSELLRREVANGALSLVAFTSASAVKAFAAALNDSHELISRTDAASIGPATSNALREIGANITVEARESTLDGLVRAIVLSTADPDEELSFGADLDSDADENYSGGDES